MINKEWLDLLNRSLHETLSEEEADQLQEALATSEGLRQEQARLTKMQGLLKEMYVEKKEDFAESVMARIQASKEVDFGATILSLFPKVAAACLLVFAITLISIYMTEGSLSIETIVGLHDLSLEDTITLVDY